MLQTGESASKARTHSFVTSSVIIAELARTTNASTHGWLKLSILSNSNLKV
jgi:hypothetical protein